MQKKLKAINKYLIVLSGPTASGKSSLSLELAKTYNAPIISADSRQIYKYMNIGTSKVSKMDRQMVTHYMVDILEPGEQFSAGQFEKMAGEILQDVFRKKDICILCGGTAFYIESLVYGLDEFPVISPEIKNGLEDDLLKIGLAALVEELKNIDPDLCAKMDLNNPRRVLRALSLYRQTGKAPSHYFNKKNKKLTYKPIFILLMPERDELYQKINSRVDQMITEGLESEARFIYEKYPNQFRETVGYAEFKDYFEGKGSLREAIDLIKRNSRRYAKRQMTWFRRKEEWGVFHPTEKQEISNYLNGKIQRDK